ncbi:MAG: hypothetical protein ACC652_11805 [Acidimicrobiales bacterium]
MHKRTVADGENVGVVTADLYRQDLKEAGIGDETYGFQLQLNSAPLHRNTTMTVS